MMTVNEVSKLTGVSIRTLHYYDKIGLLHPAFVTESGYRQYDDTALERLQQIELLTLKKEHLENLITFAREIKLTGVNKMDFKVFDKTKIEEYAKQAKEQWGNTEAYAEFEQKNKGRSEEETKQSWIEFMQLFAEFGKLKDKKPEEDTVQMQVKKVQDYITEHFYKCTNEILKGLGKMYATDGEFKENIDRAGGEGCAQFVSEAIAVYCR